MSFEHSSDRGLESSTKAGTSYDPGDFARWAVAAVGDSYIERMDFPGLSHLPTAVPACTKIGIFDPGVGDWESGTSYDPVLNSSTNAPESICLNLANQTRHVWVGDSDDPDGGGDAEGADGSTGVFALELSSGGLQPARAANLLQGATVYRYDRNNPEFLSSAPSSSGWEDDGNPSYSIAPSLSDDGLGVKSITFAGRSIDTDDTPDEIQATHPCDGDHSDRCPASWNTGNTSWGTTFNYTLPEGEVPLGLTAKDIVGNSATQAWTKKIDRTAPTLTLTGGLAPTETGGPAERFTLHAQATDGNPATAATRRSGVASLQISINGSVVQSASPGCTAPEGSCSLSLDHELDHLQYAGQTVDIVVTATDVVGHVQTQSYQKTLFAGTSLPTTISSDMTLTKGDSPYSGTSVSVTIASGATVTAEPGTSVKLSGALTVNGTLTVQGSATQPVRFTSTQNSAAGQWSGITLNSSGSSLNQAIVRYATTGITIGGSTSPQITNSTIRNNSSAGISGSSSPQITDNTIINNGSTGINLGAGAPEVARNMITDNAGTGIALTLSGTSQGTLNIHHNTIARNAAGVIISAPTSSTQITAVSLGDNTITDNTGRGVDYSNIHTNNPIPPDIDENSLTGNGQNGIWLSGRITQTSSWEDGNYPFVVSGVNIASGATLTLTAGLVLKIQSSLTVNGTLDALGTAASPVTFTSIKDDTADGDTNGDGGVTQPAAGDWIKIEFTTSGSGTLDYTQIRYGGSSPSGGDFAIVAIKCPCASQTAVTHSVISDSKYSGVSTFGAASPQITDNTLSDNGFSGAFAIDITGAGAPEIARNTLADNWSGIRYTAASGTSGAVNIHDNVIDGSIGWPALHVSVSSSSIQPTSLGGNTVRNISSGQPISFSGSGAIPPDIDENTLSGMPKTESGSVARSPSR